MLRELTGTPRLVARLIHGAGLRLGECLRLRLPDVDLLCGELRISGGAGTDLRPRSVPLPRELNLPLLARMRSVRELRRRDLRRGGAGRGGERPGTPRSRRRPPYLFPGPRPRVDPATGRRVRPHLPPRVLRRGLRAAGRRAGVRSVTFPALRRAYAARMARRGYGRREIRALLGRRCAAGRGTEG